MTNAVKRRLLVVESPIKARTLRAFLPAGHRVVASMGHVRDLPASADEIPAAAKGEEWARLGVNVEDRYDPLYVIPPSKKKVIRELKKELQDADELIVATDEDREGESIGWHLVEVLEPKIPVSRIVFHEITREAIREALRSPRGIDQNLVRAQETRRILDRLVGYTLSPLLWKKIAAGLSAGRVQSVAVRLLVVRERERLAFRAGSYWDLKARLEQGGEPFEAVLAELDGKRLASGKDFDQHTGRLAEGKEVLLLGEEKARELAARLERAPWEVTGVEEKKSTRAPAPPFTTSTLQQEANRKLGLSARDTMRSAQRLYEQGLITYMRTDSVHLSQEAILAARGRVRELYGDHYLSDRPRQYKTKSRGAQEAHEAIRPAGTRMLLVGEVAVTGRERALYELIWTRTVASQMAEARQTHVSARVQAENALFRASGKRIDFPGFFRVYVEGSDDPKSALEDRASPLPALKPGDRPELIGLEPAGHETQPPARYTEASLVATLEKEGIGRPSTYASIIGTIIDRGYADKRGSQLAPTYTAFAVTALLEGHFPELVDTGFTARMEDELDEISRGESDWLPYLERFYRGPGGLESKIAEGEQKIDAREASTVVLEGVGVPVRIGRFGPFVEAEGNGGPVTASLPQESLPGELSGDRVQELLRAKAEGPAALGSDPASGEKVYLLDGPYGPYLQLGEAGGKQKPQRCSLPKGVEPASVRLQDALAYLSLPRELGVHPETGEPVKAGIGRYGPYTVHDGDFRSLQPHDDVLTIGLGRALDLLAQPKRGKAAARGGQPLRELGTHPTDGEAVTVHAGRYGPYLSHAGVNATLPKDEQPEEVTLERALELLELRGRRAGKGRGRKARAAPSRGKK
ncbi:MAG: type I DNA topoisomerase [Longimicrobiaceae bacterium]